MKILKFLVLILVIASCKTETFNSNIDYCKYFEKLKNDDQKYRGLDLMVDPFFKILDSLRVAAGLTKEDYKNLGTVGQLEFGKKARTLADKIEVEQETIDSLMKLQILLDNKNTKSLINNTKKFGYPNIEKLKCNYAPDLVFLHSQEKYHKRIKKVIDKEFEKDRIDKNLYAMILRHIGGRKENDLQKVLIENGVKENEIIEIK